MFELYIVGGFVSVGFLLGLTEKDDIDSGDIVKFILIAFFMSWSFVIASILSKKRREKECKPNE